MADRYYSPKRAVLLTGAGFSKPFGGYLASEMWSIIFNELNSSDAKRLRGLLLGELNYERAYDLVMTGEFSSEEKSAFTTALVKAYSDLDRSIRVHLQNNSNQITPIQYFIGRFAGKGKERGFVFTLNQDLLIERFGSQGEGLLQIPALHHPDWFTPRFRDQACPETNILNLPLIDQFRQNFWAKTLGLQNLLYIKLHGSYGWTSPRTGSAMVIGYNKAGSISQEPILNWYFDLFREILSTENITLVVVGYGFMDSHINQLIVGAAKTGLQLHVISPVQPKHFKNYLLSLSSTVSKDSVPYGGEIWEMLSGYHCSSIERMFPANASALPGSVFLKHVGI